LRLADTRDSYAPPLRIIVKENISNFPLDDVGVGVTPPAHLIVTPDPLIFNVPGIYPVAPWVVIKFTVNTLPPSVGTFVMLTVKFADKAPVE
jgi:hypothetical protein